MPELQAQPARSAVGGAPWARPFHVMAKPAGARCNLACTYCFYLEKEPALYPAALARMSDATLEAHIRDHLASQPGDEVNFTWQGGEPGVSYLCPSYRRFFTHIDPAMRRMASLLENGRPAADVMRRA